MWLLKRYIEMHINNIIIVNLKLIQCESRKATKKSTLNHNKRIYRFGDNKNLDI